jgi:serine/threonine-protein kinase RIO1
MGLIHGDVNRHNFIVDRSNGHVRMIDFEHAGNFDEKQARLELESLASHLVEETGRGGPAAERKLAQESWTAARNE